MILYTSAINLLAVAIRLGGLLVLNKILAVALGPGGYAIFGQAQNFFTICAALASGGISTGLTTLVARYSKSESALRKIFSS